MLTIPGQVNGPKLANNAITTDTAVSQDLGVIGRDNQNRIRWGNLLTLPVAQGGLLYVEPVYASPGASDAASSYPRLIRVAMMYNDKVGYGPTVRDALTELFGPGAGATATGPAPTDLPNGQPPAAAPPTDGQPAAPPANQAGRATGGADADRGRAGAGRSDPAVGREGRGAAGGANRDGCAAPGTAKRRLRRIRDSAAAPGRRDEQVQQHQVIAPGRGPSLNRYRAFHGGAGTGLGADLVAEEAEDEDTLGALRRYGCNISQGSFTPCPCPPTTCCCGSPVRPSSHEVIWRFTRTFGNLAFTRRGVEQLGSSLGS